MTSVYHHQSQNSSFLTGGQFYQTRSCTDKSQMSTGGSSVQSRCSWPPDNKIMISVLQQQNRSATVFSPLASFGSATQQKNNILNHNNPICPQQQQNSRSSHRLSNRSRQCSVEGSHSISSGSMSEAGCSGTSRNPSSTDTLQFDYDDIVSQHHVNQVIPPTMTPNSKRNSAAAAGAAISISISDTGTGGPALDVRGEGGGGGSEPLLYEDHENSVGCHSPTPLSPCSFRVGNLDSHRKNCSWTSNLMQKRFEHIHPRTPSQTSSTSSGSSQAEDGIENAPSSPDRYKKSPEKDEFDLQIFGGPFLDKTPPRRCTANNNGQAMSATESSPYDADTDSPSVSISVSDVVVASHVDPNAYPSSSLPQSSAACGDQETPSELMGNTSPSTYAIQTQEIRHYHRQSMLMDAQEKHMQEALNNQRHLEAIIAAASISPSSCSPSTRPSQYHNMSNLYGRTIAESRRRNEAPEVGISGLEETRRVNNDNEVSSNQNMSEVLNGGRSTPPAHPAIGRYSPDSGLSPHNSCSAAVNRPANTAVSLKEETEGRDTHALFNHPRLAPSTVDTESDSELHHAPHGGSTTATTTLPQPMNNNNNVNEHNSRLQSSYCTDDPFESSYKVGRVLGVGGFGTVYAGMRYEDGRSVAIKKVSRSKITNWGMINGQRVPLEVCLMKQVSGSPSGLVVQILDCFERCDAFFIVMERPSNCIDLFTFITQRKVLDENLSRHFFKQVVAAVIECQRAGVSHRDLKDENLLVDLQTMRLKLIDFGSGALVKEGPYYDFEGTRVYAPPEWIRYLRYYGESAAVWSMGILLFDMVCGYLPYSTDWQICFDTVLPFRQHVSLECRHLIRHCLQKLPSQRIRLEEIIRHPWVVGYHVLHTSTSNHQLTTSNVNNDSGSSHSTDTSHGQGSGSSGMREVIVPLIVPSIDGVMEERGDVGPHERQRAPPQGLQLPSSSASRLTNDTDMLHNTSGETGVFGGSQCQNDMSSSISSQQGLLLRRRAGIYDPPSSSLFPSSVEDYPATVNGSTNHRRSNTSITPVEHQIIPLVSISPPLSSDRNLNFDHSSSTFIPSSITSFR